MTGENSYALLLVRAKTASRSEHSTPVQHRVTSRFCEEGGISSEDKQRGSIHQKNISINNS